MDKKRKAWLFDVDGTLANVDSILHHVVNKDRTSDKFKRDFDAFHADSVHVPPHKEVVEMVWKAIKEGYDILVVTARREEWRAHTAFWMKKNDIPHDALFMRQDDDYRPDYEVKKDILVHINRFWEIVHAVDDNPKILKLWEENDIPTTRIGDWDGEYK